MTWIWDYLSLDSAMGLAKVVAVIAAIFVAAYVLQTVSKLFRPMAVAIRWLFAVRPDRPPNDAVAGMIAGLRIVAWAGILAAALVLCFGRSHIGLWGGSDSIKVIHRVEESHEPE